jgi:hypothetical protein
MRVEGNAVSCFNTTSDMGSDFHLSFSVSPQFQISFHDLSTPTEIFRFPFFIPARDFEIGPYNSSRRLRSVFFAIISQYLFY